MVNKKRFHKAFNAALPHCKTSRKKAGKQEREEDYLYMCESFDRGYDD